MLFDTNAITLDELKDPLLLQKNVRLWVLRLDKIHPVVSGNKLFKLHYFLAEAETLQKSVITYGGAYSNHLVATAFACEKLNIPCLGVVRGDEPAELSFTLQACQKMGMQLQFVSRKVYSAIATKQTSVADALHIPEGGYHPTGALGASLITDLIRGKDFTHICTATGTATTLAGLLLKAEYSQEVLSFTVLRGFTDIPERLQFLTGKDRFDNLTVFGEYHWGGYAKKTAELLDYMNRLYKKFGLPTDFVYTAKMMFGIFDQVQKGYFAEGSNIVCLHTGGLQGNQSLPDGSLIF